MFHHRTNKYFILASLVLSVGIAHANCTDSKFLMTANRQEIVQAYLDQCKEKNILHQELHRRIERNRVLEHDHFSLKAEYTVKGVAIGFIAAIASYLSWKILNR